MVCSTTLVVRRVYHYRNACVLFVVSIELGSADPTRRDSLFQTLALRVCLYIVVLVYNPPLLPLLLVNFMVLGSAEPRLSKMLLCNLLSYR